MHLKTDWVETRISGTFNCPACESEQPFRKVLDKYYMTFLNFPLFAMQQTGTGVECATCRVKFTYRQLDAYEATKEGRGQKPAMFAGTAARCVLRLLGADRSLNDDVVALLTHGFRIHSEGDEIERDDIFAMRSSIQTGDSVVANVCELTPILTGEQRQLLANHLSDAAHCYRDERLVDLASELREILEGRA